MQRSITYDKKRFPNITHIDQALRVLPPNSRLKSREYGGKRVSTFRFSAISTYIKFLVDFLFNVLGSESFFDASILDFAKLNQNTVSSLYVCRNTKLPCSVFYFAP